HHIFHNTELNKYAEVTSADALMQIEEPVGMHSAHGATSLCCEGKKIVGEEEEGGVRGVVSLFLDHDDCFCEQSTGHTAMLER
ncbi:hypothetical protein ACJX0J_028857, partial [Zea mays]